jgi:hypothetical protein
MSAFRTPEERWAADAALLASGEPLASLAELAQLLGVPPAVVKRAAVAARYVVGHVPPIRYAIADVRPAVEAHLKAEERATAKRRRLIGPPRAQRHEPEVYIPVRRSRVPSSARLQAAKKPPKSA